MPTVSARYDYVDEAGILLFQVERLLDEKGKGFRQRRPDPDRDGAWIYNLDDTRRVLYRLPRVIETVAAAGWIVVVEGERDVHSLEKQGRVATTIPGGAGKWREEYETFLLGAKVAIIADADGPGRKHALNVACRLDPIAERIAFYEPAPPHKDVTEHLEAGLDLSKLVPFDWRAARPTVEPATELRVISIRELMETPDPDEHDFLLGNLVMRGARMVVGAYSGEGKTTLSLQMLRAILSADEFLSWRGGGNGARGLVLDVEQGRRTIKRRFVEVGLHELSAGKVELIHEPDGLALDSDERQLRRLGEIFRAGRYDVVLADPLYKLHRGDPNDERKVVDMMRRLDAWRIEFGFALLIPMHCRKPQAGVKFSMNDIAGSLAYTHGCEVVIGLQRAKRGYAHLHWWKDREGDLGCLHERWGLLFDQERGFRRDPHDLDRQPIRARVKATLETTPNLTINDLRDEVDAKQATIRRALDDIGAVHDGAARVGDRHWSLPATLFDEGVTAV